MPPTSRVKVVSALMPSCIKNVTLLVVASVQVYFLQLPELCVVDGDKVIASGTMSLM